MKKNKIIALLWGKLLIPENGLVEISVIWFARWFGIAIIAAIVRADFGITAFPGTSVLGIFSGVFLGCGIGGGFLVMLVIGIFVILTNNKKEVTK